MRQINTVVYRKPVLSKVEAQYWFMKNNLHLFDSNYSQFEPTVILCISQPTV